jgi:hypothetical protein
MTDRTITIWKIVFFFSGLYNVGLGLYFMLDLERGMELFTTYRTAEPHSLFVFFLFWLTITAIGLSFWQVTYNLRSNRAWLSLVSIGKMAICLVFAYGYIKNLASLLAVLIGIGDLLWGVFFVLFLYQSRKLVHNKKFK